MIGSLVIFIFTTPRRVIISDSSAVFSGVIVVLFLNHVSIALVRDFSGVTSIIISPIMQTMLTVWAESALHMSENRS